MAAYDSADLLDRCRKLARRPSTDAATDDDDWYRYLSDAQLYWLGQFQIHFPRLNWDTWEQMTAAADNKSFTFAGVPLGRVEIFPSERAPYALRAGTPDDHAADFYWDGESTIRIPGNVARSFPTGPYARYVARPSPISASVEPVILPEDARLLLVYSAVEQWAHEGGLRDPQIYKDLIDAMWLGQRPGDVGLLGRMKVRFAADPGGASPAWWRSPDLSNIPVYTG